MIEKDSHILLTEDDLREYFDGRVSARLQDLWKFSYEELKKIVEHNNYKVI
jgi:hypothetical protein